MKEGAGKARAADGSREGGRALEILNKDSGTDGDEHAAPKRHVQCDFQFRDISVNALGNFKGLSGSQSLLMLQTYGRNLKKVSSQNAMYLQLMHWMNVQWNIIIKTLPSVWTSLRFEGALWKRQICEKRKMLFMRSLSCFLVKQEDRGWLGFSKKLVPALSSAPCSKSARSLFPLLTRKWWFREGHTTSRFRWLPSLDSWLPTAPVSLGSAESWTSAQPCCTNPGSFVSPPSSGKPLAGLVLNFHFCYRKTSPLILPLPSNFSLFWSFHSIFDGLSKRRCKIGCGFFSSLQKSSAGFSFSLYWHRHPQVSSRFQYNWSLGGSSLHVMKTREKGKAQKNPLTLWRTFVEEADRR